MLRRSAPALPAAGAPAPAERGLRGLARRLARGLRAVRGRAGSVAVVTAISFPVMIGFVGLTVEVGMWLLIKRAMQGAADAASYSGAVALLLSGSANYVSQAQAVAAQNGWQDGVNNITVTVNNPPKFGAFAGNANGVEVIIQQPQPRMISALLPGTQATTVAARSVTLPIVPGDCLLALDPNLGDNGINATGNGTVNLNCGFIDNSNVNIQGSGKVNATAGSLRGSVQLQGGAGAVLNPAAPYIYQNIFPDPYSRRALPTPAACTAANTGVTYKNTTQSISPGTFCNGLTFDSNANITLQPGAYIIYGGTFDVRSNANVSGNGVTIVLTGSSTDHYNPNYANASVTSTGNFSITAPSTAPAGCPGCTGLAFFQDRNAPTSPLQSSALGGNGVLNVTGALYFPTQQLSYNGNGSTSACTQIVAFQVTLNGNGTLQDNCTGTGVVNIVGPGQISVLE